jgi:hypothetical protein
MGRGIERVMGREMGGFKGKDVEKDPACGPRGIDARVTK